MKEFANKHPWLTLFIIGTVVDGVVRVVRVLAKDE